LIDLDWVRGAREGGEPRGLPWGDLLFGYPDGVWRGLSEEVGPVRGLGLLYGFKVAEFGLSYLEEAVGGSLFLGRAGGLRKLLAEGGKEQGRPRRGYWERLGPGYSGFDCCRESGVGG